MRRAIRSGTSVLACVLVVSGARAQDFAAPANAGPARSALCFVERGLAPMDAGVTAEAAATRWFGLPDLVTRSVGLGMGWRSARAALGISQTGDPEIGWSAAGVALGAATTAAGIGVRAVARRDRAGSATAAPRERVQGGEIGGGGWVEAAVGLTLWASAPQLWRRGAMPPLPRALEIGASYRAGGLELWFARSAPARPDAAPARTLGASLAAGPCSIWIESRDHPLRAAFGFTGRARALRASATIESHPVLGETVRAAIGFERAAAGR